LMLSMQAPAGTKAHVPLNDQQALADIPADTWTSERPDQGVYQVRIKDNGVKEYADNTQLSELDFNGGTVPRLEIALSIELVDVSGMAFHSVNDRYWTGIPVDPADYDVKAAPDSPALPESRKRVLSYPTTSATLHLAAVGAQCARIFDGISGYTHLAQQCASAASSAWQAVNTGPNIYRYEFDDTQPHESWLCTDISAGCEPGSSSFVLGEFGENGVTLQWGFALSPQFPGGGAYGDNRLEDERYWAGSELELTQNTTGLINLDDVSGTLISEKKVQIYDWINGFDWQNVSPLAKLSAVASGEADAATRAAIVDYAVGFVDDQVYRNSKQSYRSPFQTYDPDNNDTNYPWGSNGGALNRAILMATAHGLTTDLTKKEKLYEGVKSVMSYLLGRNPMLKSYISGYGERSFSNPHHRFFAKHGVSGPDYDRRANLGWATVPPGFVAGGPNTRDALAVFANANRDQQSGTLTKKSDHSAYFFLFNTLDSCKTQNGEYIPERCYTDHINDFATNEVAINWQGPLTWVSWFLSPTSISGGEGYVLDWPFGSGVSHYLVSANQHNKCLTDVPGFEVETLDCSDEDRKWEYRSSDNTLRLDHAPWICMGVEGSVFSNGSNVVLKRCSTAPKSQIQWFYMSESETIHLKDQPSMCVHTKGSDNLTPHLWTCDTHDKNGRWMAVRDIRNELSAGDYLGVNERLVSLNGKYDFRLQGDSNMILRKISTDKVLWKAGWGSGGTRLHMQRDLNLVLYNPSGRPVWSSQTWSSGPKSDSRRLYITNDGKLIIVDQNENIVWEKGG